MMARTRLMLWKILAIATAASLAAPTAGAQEAQEPEDAADLEQIVVTGTRREGQSPTETLSPISVLSGEALDEQATYDMTEALPKLAPSLNTQRFPIADGTSFIRPVTLRNLSPDHTLVLVNGSRRHRSPLVNLQFAPLGTVNQGAQAVDFAALPAAAIDRIEVLRDGASAQYGSDAIAGVINVILKDANEGLTLSGQTGEYFEGDGTRTTIAANAGFGLTENGFLNVTAEYSSSDQTSRGVPHADCGPVAAAAGADAVPLDGLCQRWGDPEVDVLKFFVNSAIDVSEAIELYGQAGYSDNETLSDFFYRNPVLPPSAGVAGRSTLIVDLNGDFIPDAAPQALVDDITAAGLNPSDYLTADAGSASGFVLLNPIHTLFPGGYNPDFGADLQDISVVAGIRGDIAGGLLWDAWDLRVRWAEAEAEYTLSDTINPSLGGLSPTSFRPGTLTQEETGINADLVKELEVGGLSSPLNLAYGLEWRDETYEIGAGDPASRTAGPAFIYGVGSDGFQGFPVESGGSFSSDSIAGYVDVETDLTDRLSAGAAIRYEDYDEFGNTFDWKLSGRMQVTDTFALRATVNTGFRAPTPGQINTLNVTTTADTSGNLIPSGTYPVGHPVALTLGSTPLTPEESTSYTVGAIFQPLDNTSITLDYYDISIEDRLALLGPNVITAADVPALTAAGVENAALLVGSSASFFANAFDSDVSGVDLVVTSDFELGPGFLTVDLRHNYNQQEVSNVVPNTINASRVFDLENQVPEQRTILTFDYQTEGLFGGYVRLNRYGSWKSTGGLFSPGDASDVSSYGAEILVDVEAQFRFAEIFTIAVGGENVFDTEPDLEQDPVLQFLGVEQALTSPFGFNGGFWYVRASVEL
jgi:iron complex outermembrane recepter protein